MRRWLGLTVLVPLLAGGAYVAQDFGGLTLGGKPTPLESRWKTEEEWLVYSIARDLGEMARFASAGRLPTSGDVETVVGPPPSAGGPVSVSVSLAPGVVVKRVLPLERFIWSPDDYQELAKDLLDAAGVVALSPAPEIGADFVLTSLTDPRPAVIEQANLKVSAALAKRFADPALHESAALVLAAFSLREAAGSYSDARVPLCRMTAHLAMAGSLRGSQPAGLEGRFAHAALSLLAGRGADAATALKALEVAADPGRGPEAWRRALGLRLTEDTRIGFEPTTLLERRELYRALLWTVGSSAAADFAARLAREDVTDWGRLATELEVSVQTGHAFLREGLPRELGEAREVWALARGRSLPDADLAAALNEPAERCITRDGPRVIGWGTWAEFLQRHLIAFIWNSDHHQRHMLGLPAGADREFSAIERRFGTLTLYPLVEARVTSNASRRPARFDDVVSLVAERPERVNAGNWWAASELARYEVIRRGMPEARPWFGRGLPRGTSFDFMSRNWAKLLPKTAEALRVLHAISPQDVEVMGALVAAQFKKGTGKLEEIEAIFGGRVAYDLKVLKRLADATEHDLAAHGRILERRCALSAERCFEQGEHLVEVGDLGGAAVAYQRGLDLSSDQVLAANNSQWLVNRYLDIGDRSRAREVAEKAAGTGSGAGMIAMAGFLERTGDFEGAESVLRQVIERYGNRPQTPDEREEALDGEQDQDRLIGFYYRMAVLRKRPDHQKRFLEMTRQDFPNGIERADPKGFSGRPPDGVFVLKTWPYAERAGLKAGDIIVGLDGIRVRTRRQYDVVRAFSDSPEMTLVVFRHPGIIELKARSVWRRLGLGVRSHKPVDTAPPD